MPVLRVKEQQPTATGFQAILELDGAEYEIEVADPFTPPQERCLEWYFEEWLMFPLIDKVKAEQARESVNSYGKKLFEQVFKRHIDAYAEYRQLRNDLSQVQLEIVGKTPEFQALHWEAMQDPDLPRPLAVDCVMVRKHIQPVPVKADVEVSPAINLLVVIARPDEENDIGYRTISRPLIEAIQNSQLRVNIELLRPGTFEALSQHLEDKAGFYHIIHFDVHGALLSYQQYSQGVKANRYLYQARYGRDDIAEYEGVKAFLFLEGEEKGKADPVEATELAELLTLKKIPVCILNACQSGKQINDTRETSLGSRLMTAGMQMVVAMSYSVTVTAAKLLMEKVYQHLFDRKGINEAIRLGRKELFNRKNRKAYFNQFIDLEDWLLPVVYCNQKVDLKLREFSPQEEEAYYESLGSQFRFSLPEYGFVGRDLEILKIEKALFKHNILLLRGMGGTGKTTLLNYLREWWQTTNFVKDVFYFGYDQKAWTLTQILFEIGARVYDKYEMGKFQTFNLAAQVQKLVAKLRAEPYAIILDNLESVTGQELAIPNTLPEAERQQIKDFLARLAGGDGRTKVILGSRSGEEWLQAQTFRNNIYNLQGLDPEARTELAEKILERHVAAKRIPAMREDGEFKRLMEVLAGYPLAMEVVLANLQRKSPAEILAGLQIGELEDRDSEDKTKSILKCVEYSHSNLSIEAQKLLLCLAPFSGFIVAGVIPNYIEQLQKLEPFKDYSFEQFNEAIQEAINWGLLSPFDENMPSLLRIQPVFPFFLKTKLENVDAATQLALREGFKNHYQGLAGSYQQLMESKDAQERQLGIFFCKLEYENLYNALQVCLEKQESIDIFFCLDKYFELINDIQSRLKLAKFVCQAQAAYPPEIGIGRIGLHIVMALERLAACQLQTQNYKQARESYQQVIKLLENLQGISESQIKSALASTYHQLGIVAQDLRQWEEAKANYLLALEIKIEFGDRYNCADTYHQLGNVAQDLRQWEEAKANFLLALEICIEFGDRYSCASTYHQLGIVAQNLRQWEEAKANYQQALEIYIEFGDRYSCAITYHQLGRVAQELRQWEEAKANYLLALEIKIEFGDRYSCAITYHTFAMVAEETGELEEAKTNYLQALQIWMEFNDKHGLGISLQNLARFYQSNQDDNFLAAAARILGATVEELRQAINNADE